MHIHYSDVPWLIVEETLQILEECLQLRNSKLAPGCLEKSHIQQLKKYYSPEFEIEYSESGSYFYATLRCMLDYCNTPQTRKQLQLSATFIKSAESILNINLIAMHSISHSALMAEQCVELAELWGLQHENDIHELLKKVLQQMRLTLINPKPI